MTREKILILDFGSQYVQLIARRVRELGVYSEVVPARITGEEVRRHGGAGIEVKGIVLSGGPASVDEVGAPTLDPGLLQLGIPVLGLCYGMQLGARLLGAEVVAGKHREYGRTRLAVTKPEHPLWNKVPRESTVWMSHGDSVHPREGDFDVLATSGNCPVAAVAHRHSRFVGLQFHPEVSHSEHGMQILRNFIISLCGCRGDWDPGSLIDELVGQIRIQVGEAGLVCGLSGGVDSAVAAALVARAAGKRLHCLLVDNGLLRGGEVEEIDRQFSGREDLDFRVIPAADRFVSALAGVLDPEAKRKIIGKLFIDIFEEEAKKLPGVKFLVQGTIYPDVIESRPAFGGPTARIKSHHNVGGLPERMGLSLTEPLRLFFKDEVRQLGLRLGLPEKLLWRHPFPGPGLAVRAVGEITWERLARLRSADAILREEITRAGWDRKVWQAFAVLLPVRSVGVMGDGRTYQEVVALRVVDSRDGMTADWVDLPDEILRRTSSRIVNEVSGVNRVVYDISSKPPSTIEWE